MSTSFRICKVLTLPVSGLFTDAMYLVKAGQDTFDCYVTDNAGHALRLSPGESAYAAAVRAGFNGTEQQWLDSLKGDTGLSAYQIAVLNGFNGTEQEWLDSLHGNAGYTAENVDNKSDDNTLANNTPDAYPTVRAVKGYVDTKAGQTLEQANTAANSAASAAETSAKTYAGTVAGTAETSAKAHADTVAGTAETNAKSYALTVANDAEVAAKAYADLILASAVSLRGGYDASGNAWPTTGGTGTAGAIKAGNLWFVSAPGTLGGKSVVVGDSFFAVTNNPGQTNANWCVLDTNLGFVPEEAGTAAAAIAAHLLAADPHGDRAYALGLINGHISANDPHGDRAAAAAALAAHASASDPHGDRTYTDGAISTALTARINTQTASYQLTAADGDGRTLVRMNVGTANNLTVPLDATAAIVTGRPITVRQAGAGATTIVAEGGVALNGTTTFAAQHDTKTLIKVAANTWDIIG